MEEILQQNHLIKRYFSRDAWEEKLQQRHLGEDTSEETLGRDTLAETLKTRYFSIDTCEEILLQRHLRGDTSTKTPWRRYFGGDTW